LSSAKQSMDMHLLAEVGKDLQTLTPEMMDIAWQQLQQAEADHSFVTFADVADLELRQKLERLFYQLDTIGGRLPHSNSSRITARREIYALMLKFGPPDLFIT